MAATCAISLYNSTELEGPLLNVSAGEQAKEELLLFHQNCCSFIKELSPSVSGANSWQKMCSFIRVSILVSLWWLYVPTEQGYEQEPEQGYMQW